MSPQLQRYKASSKELLKIARRMASKLEPPHLGPVGSQGAPLPYNGGSVFLPWCWNSLDLCMSSCCAGAMPFFRHELLPLAVSTWRAMGYRLADLLARSEPRIPSPKCRDVAATASSQVAAQEGASSSSERVRITEQPWDRIYGVLAASKQDKLPWSAAGPGNEMNGINPVVCSIARSVPRKLPLSFASIALSFTFWGPACCGQGWTTEELRCQKSVADCWTHTV